MSPMVPLPGPGAGAWLWAQPQHRRAQERFEGEGQALDPHVRKELAHLEARRRSRPIDGDVNKQKLPGKWPKTWNVTKEKESEKGN